VLRRSVSGTSGVLAGVAVAVASVVLAGCGGSGGTADAGDLDVVGETEELVTTTTVESERDTEATGGIAGPGTSGPAPAPGEGVLALDDGRTYALTIRECRFHEQSRESFESFTIQGAGEGGAGFEMHQTYVGESWIQSSVELELPNEISIHTIASGATEGVGPARFEGKSIAWGTPTFRELDAVANRYVYTGEGAVRITCP
jgi:hypothetical protein